MIFTRAAVIALTATALTTALGATTAQAATPKQHYIGHCQASGSSYPICTISARTAYDVRHVYIHVWGHVYLPGGVSGRIEADVDNLCTQGTGDGDDSAVFKAYPSYVRSLPQAYTRPSECYASAVISPVSYEAASAAVYASMYYIRRDGR